MKPLAKRYQTGDKTISPIQTVKLSSNLIVKVFSDSSCLCLIKNNQHAILPIESVCDESAAAIKIADKALGSRAPKNFLAEMRSGLNTLTQLRDKPRGQT
jgi:hypothetical protein